MRQLRYLINRRTHDFYFLSYVAGTISPQYGSGEKQQIRLPVEQEIVGAAPIRVARGVMNTYIIRLIQLA